MRAKWIKARLANATGIYSHRRTGTGAAVPSPERRLKDQSLISLTGADSVYWVGQVQDLIRVYFEAEPDNPHPYCDVTEWMGQLTQEIAERVEATMTARGQPYEENMTNAYVLSLVLSIWFVRLQHAKSRDPRRPVALRQIGAERAAQAIATYTEGFVDESLDTTYFTQPWDLPFSPDAINGDFV